MTDKINPIKIKIEEDNIVYTLEFSRETVIFTNNQGFVRSEFEDRFEEMLPILFYGAFRMHHKKVSRNETDRILNEVLRGLKKDEIFRLLELYLAPRNALIRDDDDEEDDDENSKNCRATVIL